LSRVPAREGGVAAAAASYGGGHRGEGPGSMDRVCFWTRPTRPPSAPCTRLRWDRCNMRRDGGAGGAGKGGREGTRMQPSDGGARRRIPSPPSPPHPTPFPLLPAPSAACFPTPARPAERVRRPPFGVCVWQVCDCFLFDKGRATGARSQRRACVARAGGGDEQGGRRARRERGIKIKGRRADCFFSSSSLSTLSPLPHTKQRTKTTQTHTHTHSLFSHRPSQPTEGAGKAGQGPDLPVFFSL
jgi:hypothetical protein